MDFNQPHIAPISKEFYSEKTDQPFCNCKMCNKELLENDEQYIIEKAFSQDVKTGVKTLIFEMVYCLECMQGIQAELSEESQEKIQKYFADNTNLDFRNSELTKYELYETDIWLNNCIIKNKDISELPEYQITSICQGRNMFYHHTPYMVSGEVTDEVMMLLSNKSLDTLNDLWDDLLDLPAEVRDIFKKRPVFF